MNFTNIVFLYYFLPCFFLLYFLVPDSFKNFVLFLGSVLFYAWGEAKFVLLMLFIILVDYLSAIFMDCFKKHVRIKKIILAGSLFVNIGLLLYFKYAAFFLESIAHLTKWDFPLIKIALPIGISFYTFQSISYLVDAYKGLIPAQYNIINFASYISAFPQLIAGPIVRLTSIEHSLHQRKMNINSIASGIRRFILGLAKKVLIADSLGSLCDIFLKSDEKSVLFYWIYAISFTLQIYYDFSGYSDMAIGLGKILGFTYPENFNYPYISRSITEFWRRWHISLGQWFRDYVYIPLGGNRVGKIRLICNILSVWMLTGLWHGASWNFVLWGLMFGVLLLFEKICFLKHLERMRVMNHIYVLLFVVLSFVIFQAESINSGLLAIKSMFFMGNLPFLTLETGYYGCSYLIIILFACIGATPMVKNMFIRLQKNSYLNKLFAVVEIPALFLLLLVITGYLVDGSFSPFLYFRF